MQVCKQCGATIPPEHQACVSCGRALAHSNGAAAPSSPFVATPPEQHYLPAQPYVPPGQLFEAKYQHPYAYEYAAYGDGGAHSDASSDEDPTVVVGDMAVGSDPAVIAPTDMAQQAFLRYAPQYATNPLAGALIGGVVAFLVVIVLTLILQIVAGPVIGAVLAAPISSLPVTTPTPLHPLAANGFFAAIGLAHHATFVVTTSTGTFTLTYPVTTLFVIPALGLVLGGYVASATDYTRHWRMLLLRAVAIAPAYAILLMVSCVIFGTSPLHDAGADTGGQATISVASASLLLAGLCWGVIFGGLGGVVRLFGWRWRAALVALLMGRPRSSLVAGTVGAFATITVGLMLTFVAGIFIAATDGTASHLLAGLGHAHNWHDATPGYVLVLGASTSIELFIIGSGGAFTTTMSSTHALPTTAAISVFDSRIPVPYLLLLIVPALVYFCGGYLAARLTRSPEQKTHLIAGALVGVFGSVIMLMLATISGYAFSSTGFAAIGTQVSAGPDPASTFLGSLLVGMICGALGSFAFQPQLHPRRAPRTYPIEPLFALYDRLTMQPIGVARPRARSLLYLAITITLALAVMGIALDVLSGVLAQSVGATGLQNAVTLYGGLMLALPALLLLAAWVVDLMALPQGTEVVVEAALPPPPETISPPSAPYEYPIHPFTLPAMPQVERRAPVSAVAAQRYAVPHGPEGMAS